MSSAFQGKVALITGGASGIGRAIGAALVAEGAQVVLADLNAEGATQAAGEMGEAARGVALDVTDAQAVAAVVQETAAAHGRLDLMFNNAGIGVLGEVRDLSLSDWERVLAVNLNGVIHGVQAAYPLMIEQGSGHIVNTASLAGLTPAPGLTPYATAKHAVVGLSRSMRAEAQALGVKVSVVCPGMVQTPILERSETRALNGPALREKLMFGAITPEACARDVLRGVRKNKEVILVTSAAKISVFLQRYCPWLLNWFVGRIMSQIRSVREESS